MLVRLGGGDIDGIYYNATKILHTMTFILMCVRFLNLLMVSELIGAKLVMIKKMVNMTVINISSPPSQIFKIKESF
jgi:hypothetical protein